ncbi:MAG: hypothetical protein QNJ72_40885 [Pleurocapsa sp. MO_226.B13]|nr:hypothetical protein [Pleurocapsa sp. MO_226.B13]
MSIKEREEKPLFFSNSPRELISAIADFQHQINTTPFAKARSPVGQKTS